MKKLQQGFTLVEIMIVVAIIGLLAAIAIPNFVKSRETSQKNACITNLRLLDSAREQYLMERAGAVVATKLLLADYVKSWPKCPKNKAEYALPATDAAAFVCPAADAAHVLP